MPTLSFNQEAPTSGPKRRKGTCAHCGGPVSTSGRPPASGNRYCPAPGCRRAREAERRARLKEDRDAPAACAGCSTALSPRKWRSGDEFGRWCTKPTCRRKRTEAREAMAGDVDLATRLEKLENTVTFLSDVVMADASEYMHANRVTCHACGLMTAIKGWVHPTEQMAVCEGTLDGRPIRPIGAKAVGGAWPFRREYLSTEELKEAYGGA